MVVTSRKQAMVFGACGAALYLLVDALDQNRPKEAAGLLAILLGIVGVMHVIETWRKTGLLLATMAQAEAAGLFLAVGVLFLTRRFPGGSPETVVVLAVLGIAAPLLLFLESRRSPAKWQAWKQAAHRASLLQIISGDHIPYLRDP